MDVPESDTRNQAEPWLVERGVVAATLGVDVRLGLSAAEAAERLARDGPNQLVAVATVPRWRKVLAQFADPLIYLLQGAALVSLVAWVIEGAEGVPFEVIVIVVIVVLNAVLGYVQEARAEQAVAALQRMAAPTAGVVRDGREERIPAADIVRGDVLALAEGDAVGADARLVEAASLMVAEAALTGESEAVLKEVRPLVGQVGIGDRVNMVFSGTAVTRGRGRAIVTATAMRTEVGRVATLLEHTHDEVTPLQREVARIGRMLGLAVIVIAVVVIGAILMTSEIRELSDVVDVLLVGVSLAVAAVPEGLPAVLSLVLALGVQRMARRRAIVKRLSSVETLGSASVIASDKTGTLTKNEMTIVAVVTASGQVDVSGSGYRPEGELQIGGRLVDDAVLEAEVRDVLVAGSLANDSVLREQAGGWTIQGDPTEAAFLVAEAKIGATEQREARFERIAEVPFTSERKLMSTVHSDLQQDGGVAVVTKGAPDVLLSRCTHERVAGEVRPLTAVRRDEVLDAVEGLADRALRTLAVAYRPLLDNTFAREPDESIENELVYLGMVGIIDPPRSEARAAISEARGAGVRVVMITGDHPRTAARIAADLGITPSVSRALSGAEIDALDDEALRQAAGEVSVFARVAPEHKLRIVAALRAHGDIVAMTGDGVNDAPALKAADIGIAMGISGTDVTKEAADMILADDDFATIVVAVREGRAIFSNIRKFLRFLLSSNIGEVLTMFFGVVFAAALGLDDVGGSIAVPLLATQILWINLLTDTAPAMAMGVDPPPDDLMTHPPRGLDDRVIDGQMWFGIMWVGVVMAAVTLLALDLGLAGGIVGGIVGDSGDIVEARTMAFTTLVFAQLFNAFNARSDRVSAFHHLLANGYLWAAIALSSVLQVAVVELPFMNDAFDTAPMGIDGWLVCIGLASVVLWVDEAKKLVMRMIERRRPTPAA